MKLKLKRSTLTEAGTGIAALGQKLNSNLAINFTNARTNLNFVPDNKSNGFHLKCLNDTFAYIYVYQNATGTFSIEGTNAYNIPFTDNSLKNLNTLDDVLDKITNPIIPEMKKCIINPNNISESLNEFLGPIAAIKNKIQQMKDNKANKEALKTSSDEVVKLLKATPNMDKLTYDVQLEDGGYRIFVLTNQQAPFLSCAYGPSSENSNQLAITKIWTLSDASGKTVQYNDLNKFFSDLAVKIEKGNPKIQKDQLLTNTGLAADAATAANAGDANTDGDDKTNSTTKTGDKTASDEGDVKETTPTTSPNDEKVKKAFKNLRTKARNNKLAPNEYATYISYLNNRFSKYDANLQKKIIDAANKAFDKAVTTP